MSNRLWILGAESPKMQAIEQLLRSCGEKYRYAVGPDGDRVDGANACRAIGWTDGEDFFDGTWGLAFHMVECAFYDLTPDETVFIDHRHSGDPGYGAPPEVYLRASSVGQVIGLLASEGLIQSLGWPTTQREGNCYGSTGSVDPLKGVCLHPGAGCSDHPSEPAIWAAIPHELLLAAAADYCPEAACQGLCPGVDPDELRGYLAARAA
jgi:hypothetical protein